MKLDEILLKWHISTDHYPDPTILRRKDWRGQMELHLNKDGRFLTQLNGINCRYCLDGHAFTAESLMADDWEVVEKR